MIIVTFLAGIWALIGDTCFEMVQKQYLTKDFGSVVILALYIGALPGDKFDKISAWLGPIKDNIDQILGSKTLSTNNRFEEMCREGIIEVEAMAFIQGRSIPRSIIILDEAENITAREARMVIERCGKDSKVILLGDLSQVENPYLDAKSNGLAHAISGGKKNALVASVTLTKVERSELAAVASDIFNRPEARRK